MNHTLFERIGGDATITTAINKFYEKGEILKIKTLYRKKKNYLIFVIVV
jgi:truncated hemoglobin YjbI